MTGDPRTENVPAAGVYVTVEAPAQAEVRVATQQGRFSFALADLAQPRPLRLLDDDVLVEKAIVGRRVSDSSPDSHFDYPSTTTTSDRETWVAWQGYSSGGDHVYARGGDGEIQRLTDQPTDVLRTAMGEDSRGLPWVVWSERSGESWDLYGRSYDNGGWSRRFPITSGSAPNVFHRLVRDPAGKIHIVFVGHRNGQSYVYWTTYDGETGSEPREISGPSAWVPEAAADSKGNLWVTWDSYRNGNYDIYLRKISPDGTLGPEMQVTKTAAFQTHPSIAVDGDDRVWLAWHESGGNWGKDWTREDQHRSVTLYANRRPRVAIFDGQDWRQASGRPDSGGLDPPPPLCAVSTPSRGRPGPRLDGAASENRDRPHTQRLLGLRRPLGVFPHALRGRQLDSGDPGSAVKQSSGRAARSRRARRRREAGLVERQPAVDGSRVLQQNSQQLRDLDRELPSSRAVRARATRALCRTSAGGDTGASERSRRRQADSRVSHRTRRRNAEDRARRLPPPHRDLDRRLGRRVD